MQERHDIVVIGGGQAGLAMSTVLQRHGREHIVLERRRIGERWRTERWDSLRFQFPNWSLQLPGYAYRGDDPDGFAHYREIVRTVEDYAVSSRAPVRERTEVVSLAEDDDHKGFVLASPEGSIHARQVVLATGPFQRPFIPPMAGDVSPSVLQTDPTRYPTRRSCPMARCSSLAAVRPDARSQTSCCSPVAGCSCRSAGTAALRGACAARTSTGGSRSSVVSPRRSTRCLIADGRRRPSSPV
jgi:glycine/D-amino acid oxidase-like deaminating enzyme